MEKLKIALVLLLFSLVAVLTYSLTKSWFFFDKGIDLKEEEPVMEEKKISSPVFSTDPFLENAEVLWKNYLYYPVEPSFEQGGFGPSEILHHCKNLHFINLQTGKITKVFDKKVYIWDYFPGSFIKKNQESEKAEIKKSLELGQKILIFAITEDTNKDGFLNYKDKMKVYIYDPLEEITTNILPEEYFFEKMFFNTGKHLLVLVVKSIPRPKESDPVDKVFIYNTSTKSGILVDLSDYITPKRKEKKTN